MGKPKSVTLQYLAAADDTVATGQVVASGVAMTLNGAATEIEFGASGPRNVTILTTFDASAHTFTIVGRTINGYSATDSFLGPNNTTVSGTKFFTHIDSVTADGTTSDNVSVGRGPQAITKAFVMDHHQNPFNVGFGVKFATPTASAMSYSVQHTFEDPFDGSIDLDNGKWFSHSTVAAKATEQDGNYAFPVRAVRLHNVFTTVTAANCDTTLTLVQAGIRSN